MASYVRNKWITLKLSSVLVEKGRFRKRINFLCSSKKFIFEIINGETARIEDRTKGDEFLKKKIEIKCSGVLLCYYWMELEAVYIYFAREKIR